MRIGVAAVAVAAAAAALLVSPSDRARGQRARLACNADLRALKTLSDPQRNLVRLRPKVTTIAAINRLPRPHRTPTTRSTRFARQVWRVRAQIVEYKLRGNGDVHLVLYDGRRSYLIAAMPSPACLSAKTRSRRAISGARAFFEGLCGPARSNWRDLGAVAIVDGVGYWSARHRWNGHARNDAELHPVTKLRLIAGCA